MFKLNSWCLVWIQVKMGKNVGQNLQSKSHSQNRRKRVTQLQKEGACMKLSFDVCLCERCFFPFLLGHYSVGKDFTLPKGREHNMPYSSCSLSLSCKFLSTLYPSN